MEKQRAKDEGVSQVKNKTKITIDGKSFTLMGQESEEHMQQVAAYIDRKMQEIRRNSKAVAVDSSLAYILTSINVADDYFKELQQTLEMQKCLEDAQMQIIAERTQREQLEEQLEKIERDITKLRRKLQEYQMEEEAANEGLHTAKVRPRKR